jgi:hypothetical protein
MKTVLIYVNTSKEVGDLDHLKVFVRRHGKMVRRTARKARRLSLRSSSETPPKVIRQGLRLAFLAPGVTDTILSGSQPSNLTLAKIPERFPLPWAGHASAC